MEKHSQDLVQLFINNVAVAEGPPDAVHHLCRLLSGRVEDCRLALGPSAELAPSLTSVRLLPLYRSIEYRFGWGSKMEMRTRGEVVGLSWVGTATQPLAVLSPEALASLQYVHSELCGLFHVVESPGPDDWWRGSGQLLERIRKMVASHGSYHVCGHGVQSQSANRSFSTDSTCLRRSG